jgi:hypothetical protein
MEFQYLFVNAVSGDILGMRLERITVRNGVSRINGRRVRIVDYQNQPTEDSKLSITKVLCVPIDCF